MNKEKLNKLSLYCLIISAVVFIINYFFYHFVTDEGISLTWNPEPGKPFVSDLIGMLAVLFCLRVYLHSYYQEYGLIKKIK